LIALQPQRARRAGTDNLNSSPFSSSEKIIYPNLLRASVSLLNLSGNIDPLIVATVCSSTAGKD
jgi:hypothetical protein